MALPTNQFMAPTPFMAPRVGATFGMTSSDQELMALAPGLAAAPTPVQTYNPEVATSQANVLGFLSAQTGGAVGPGNDPSQWTPYEAAAQTDRAIARIGVANPELAQKLAEMRDPNTSDTGGSFLRGSFGSVRTRRAPARRKHS